MPVNRRAVLAVIGTATMLKQARDGERSKGTRGGRRSPRIMAASTAILVAGGGFYLFQKGRRNSENAFDTLASPAIGDEPSVTVEESLIVVEESGSEAVPVVTSGNGQDAVIEVSLDEAGESQSSGAADVGASERPEGHAGGVSDVIASPEAVVDPSAAPDPIVSPEPALPQQTGDGDVDKSNSEDA